MSCCLFIALYNRSLLSVLWSMKWIVWQFLGLSSKVFLALVKEITRYAISSCYSISLCGTRLTYDGDVDEITITIAMQSTLQYVQFDWYQLLVWKDSSVRYLNLVELKHGTEFFKSISFNVFSTNQLKQDCEGDRQRDYSAHDTGAQSFLWDFLIFVLGIESNL